MASQIISGAQTVSLLSANTNQSATGARVRDTGQSEFSDLLRGQMTSKSATYKQEQMSAASSQVEQRPDRTEAKSSSESNQRTESRTRDDAAGPKDNTAGPKDNTTSPSDETTSGKTDDSSRSAEAASASSDTAEADTKKVAVDDNNAASTNAGIAGLPAEIAALLPAAALKQLAESSFAETHTDVSSEGELATNITLTGDTKGKPLQNPADLQAALKSDVPLPDQAGKPVLPFQLKPEVQSGFAERAATAMQPVSADLPDGTQTSFMHVLRQPGHLTSTTPQLQVATPAGQSAWADEVGNRVMWMVGRAESKAELVLTPPSLGKVEVSINLNGDQTTAQFVAATQSARDALEQAMPRLREILAQSGISLGQANVSTSGEQQTSGEAHSQRGGRGSGEGGLDAGAGVAAPQWTKQTVGLVDTFA